MFRPNNVSIAGTPRRWRRRVLVRKRPGGGSDGAKRAARKIGGSGRRGAARGSLRMTARPLTLPRPTSGDRMRYRYRNSLVVAIVLSAAAVGIAKQASAQTITEFTTPTASSGPLGITTGPDGALWFTENTANKIGRITTRGATTEVPASTGNTLPSAN